MTAAEPSGKLTRNPDVVAGMEFVQVTGGCFQMGDTTGDGDIDEKPAHKVCVGDFGMSTFQVTNAQFRKFKPSHNSGGYKGYSLDGDNQPVVRVTWDEAVAFAQWLSKQSGKNYRLPTEAEWEYAARGGTDTRNYWGNSMDDACSYANLHDISSKNAFKEFTWDNVNCSDGYKVTAPVGSFKPNRFGLYDMIGNVLVWCQDWYDENYYRSSPADNPQGPSKGQFRVLRGGSWLDEDDDCRVAKRRSFNPEINSDFFGFRLVVTLK